MFLETKIIKNRILAKTVTTQLLFPLILIIIYPFALGAAETRQHEAHLHGVGQLNIALDEQKLFIELISPAANIVGFEHAPKSEKEEEAVKKAVTVLEDGEKLFLLPTGAKCKLHESQVDSSIAEENHEAHDEHHEEHENGHAHSAHHAEESVHSEFVTTYHFDCGKSDNLDYIDVQLFSIFPGFEELEVQLLARNKQTAVELSPKKHQISL